MNFWGPRAATIYYYGGLHPSTWGDYPHQEYPPLGPAMNAVTFHFTHGFHPSLLPVQQTLLGIAFLLAVVRAARPVRAEVDLPALARAARDGAVVLVADAVDPSRPDARLPALAGGARVHLLAARAPSTPGSSWPLLFLAAGALLKLEGSLFGALLVVVVLAAGFLRFRREALPALVLLLGPLAVVPWRLWLASNGLRASAADYSLSDLASPGYLAHRLSRVHRTVDTLAELDRPRFPRGRVPVPPRGRAPRRRVRACR